MRPLPLVAVAGSLICLSACASSGDAPAVSAPPPPKPVPSATSPMPPAGGFTEWRAGFRQRAAAAGISSQTFDRAFAGVGVNAKVLELDGRQAEFTRAIWDYLDSAVSDSRISNGRAKAAELRDVMARIEARYGVPGETVLAVWGLESAYGYNMGSIPVIESLATLAYEGRRRDFAEEQLIEALKIIQSGDVTPAAMVGSWAGAMGHTQFIPTSYQAYAQDLNGDGRRDVWSADPGDALASTANYLARFGWESGRPWGFEVRLPQGFPYAEADQSIVKPMSAWSALGVTRADGGALPAGEGEGAVLLPAGANGPAFIVLKNFRVIKRYNNATSYALAVALLSDRIAGRGGVTAAWPRGDRALSLSEKQEMQRRLTSLGFDTGGVDGIIGPNSINALRAFQSSRGLTPDGYPSAAVLERLRASGG